VGSLKLMEVPWHPWRAVSWTNVSGATKRPFSGGVALLISQFWHQLQPKLQPQLPTVRARLPG
jgi:hypothetical protein